MGSLEKRVEKLETNAGIATSRHQRWTTPYYLQRYFKELGNLRRVEAGLEPLPYTPRDLEDDRRCLEEVIPNYRANPGWQTEEAQTFCDRWEEHIRANLQRGER